MQINIGFWEIGISVPKEKRDEIGVMLKEYNRLWGLIEELTRINRQSRGENVSPP